MLHDDEGAVWIADLLRHKTNFTAIHLAFCLFPMTQILPLLRGCTFLETLVVSGYDNGDDNMVLFNDPANTQLFVSNVLLAPGTNLKTLCLHHCGVSLENRPLMSGFHKNTTLIVVIGDHDDATQYFLYTILRRNIFLGHIHDMLGTTTTMLRSSSAGVGEVIAASPTVPPPCGLWPIVLAKVGQGTQGATPVFTILRDRLATWMEP
jgi:hypothetical protein